MASTRRKTIAASLTVCLLLTAFSVAFFLFDLDFERIKAVAPQIFYRGPRGRWAPTDQQVRDVLREGTDVEAALSAVPWNIKAAFEPEDKGFGRLTCSSANAERYSYLRRPLISTEKRKYFFALDLYNNSPIMPRLFGSIVDACRFLGPKSCAISISEGRSTDGTYETLKLLESPMTKMGIQYFLNTNSLDPSRDDWHFRIETLAYLRNLALKPITDHPENYHEDAVVIFLNDASFCVNDILELVHQRIVQNADMTCGMDWADRGDPIFYDAWVSRGITGEPFFYIPLDGSWDHAKDLFWKDEKSKSRLDEYKPFQVFTCWNGGVVFPSRVLRAGIQFRAHVENECYQGEPSLFNKDMWFNGMGKIAVVPSVNVAYENSFSWKLRKRKGIVEDHTHEENVGLDFHIDWQLEPPEQVKCIVNWGEQYWVPWNESLPITQPTSGEKKKDDPPQDDTPA